MASDVTDARKGVPVIPRYEVLAFVGRGGMGSVYKVLYTPLEQVRALKVMDPRLAQDQGFVRKFRDEARALALLHNNNVVTVYDFVETETGSCIVMEFVDGNNLAHMIASRGSVPSGEFMRIFDQVLQALGHTHRAGILHRDIKPSNIMLTRDGVVKLTDFGLAKIQKKNTDVTQTQVAAGTLYYMSPEQLDSPRGTDPKEGVDERSDLYSVGMTMYEALTGTVPFEKTGSDFRIQEKIVNGRFRRPREVNPDISPELDRFIMKAIARRKADRFQSAGAMLEGMKEARSERPGPNPLRRMILVAAVFTALIAVYAGWPTLQEILSGEKRPPVTVDSSKTEDADRGPVKTERLLSITSEPGGAIVSINGARIGVTPLMTFELPEEAVTVRLEKSGYVSKDTAIAVAAGDSADLYFTLSKIEEQLGLLGINTIPSQPSVWINGVKQRGVSPFSVPGGRNLSVVVKAGSARWEKDGMRVNSGETLNLPTLDFRKRIRLTVVAVDEEGRPRGGSNILIDGRQIDDTTPKQITLPFGVHSIQVRREGVGESDAYRDCFEKDVAEPIELTLRRK